MFVVCNSCTPDSGPQRSIMGMPAELLGIQLSVFAVECNIGPSFWCVFPFLFPFLFMSLLACWVLEASGLNCENYSTFAFFFFWLSLRVYCLIYSEFFTDLNCKRQQASNESRLKKIILFQKMPQIYYYKHGGFFPFIVWFICWIVPKLSVRRANETSACNLPHTRPVQLVMRRCFHWTCHS